MKQNLKIQNMKKTANKKSSSSLWGFVPRYSLPRYSLRTTIRNVFTLLVFGVVFLMSASPAFASAGFPRVEATSDTDDILSDYPAYLHFVVEVGKDVDRSNTARLIKLYKALKRRNPKGAALFLKGLRFEMVQKLELMGRSPSEISTRTPEIRRWVGRYMKEWTREADEHLFRSVSAPNSELARME